MSQFNSTIQLSSTIQFHSTLQSNASIQLGDSMARRVPKHRATIESPIEEASK